MDVDELRCRIRGALRAASEFRSGHGGQTSVCLPDVLDQHEDLGAAQLLEHLASDVDNLDTNITSSFLALVDERSDRASVFVARSLAKAAGLVGTTLEPSDWRPWRPQAATDFLGYVVQRAKVSEPA